MDRVFFHQSNSRFQLIVYKTCGTATEFIQKITRDDLFVFFPILQLYSDVHRIFIEPKLSPNSAKSRSLAVNDWGILLP